MYDPQQPRFRRASATAEELAARRTSTTVPTTIQDTEERSVKVTPKSAIRHRPIGNMYVIPFTDGSEMRVTERELSTLPQNYQDAAQLIQSQIAAPKQKRQPHLKLPVQDDSVYEMPPARTHPQGTDALPKQRRFRFHWLFWLGLALFVMVIGWIALSALGTWWTNQTNQWTYGYPRTFQIDANVGHGTHTDPMSHFIALNLNSHIEVIEIAGDNAAKSKIYVGPTLIGDRQELTPVTLSFADVNHDGKLDMIVHVGDAQYIFLNTGTDFRPAPNQ